MSGSWTWGNGWIWDDREDSLPVLDIHSYGITTAINASTTLFTKCKIISVDKYGVDGTWEALNNFFFQDENIVFFKLQQMWHFTWVSSSRLSYTISFGHLFLFAT